MRFDPLKAFPYPVLREGTDDYIEGAFQASVHPEIIGTTDGMMLHVCGSFQLSVEPLRVLVESGQAVFGVLLDCRDTFTRQYFEFSTTDFEIKLSPGELEGEFTLSPFVVAKSEITGFECEEIHEEFGPGPFNFAPGNILAQSEDIVHHISREHFSPVTSILMFDTDEAVPEGAFRLELSGEKVIIKLSDDFRKLVNLARAQKKYQGSVLNCIYLPVIIALVSLFNEQGAMEKYEGKKWFEVIGAQMRSKGFNAPFDDPAYVAQQLLGLPLRHFATQIVASEEDFQ